MTNATLVTSSEVRTIVMRVEHDRDQEIAQDHAIRRRWSEGRVQACGMEARGAAARRTSQARAIVERTSIRRNKDLYCIEGDDLRPRAHAQDCESVQ